MSHAPALTASDFHATIAQGVVMVDFWAPWCGPCQSVGPVIDELAAELAGRVSIYKLNIDEAGEIAQEYGVMSIPTFKIFRDGQEVGTLTGALPKERILSELEKYLA